MKKDNSKPVISVFVVLSMALISLGILLSIGLKETIICYKKRLFKK